MNRGLRVFLQGLLILVGGIRVLGADPAVWPTKAEQFDEARFEAEFRLSHLPNGLPIPRLRVEVSAIFELETLEKPGPAVLPGRIVMLLEGSQDKEPAANLLTPPPERLLPATPVPLAPGATPPPVRVIPINRPETSHPAQRVETKEKVMRRVARGRPPSYVSTYRFAASAKFVPLAGPAFGPAELQAIRKLSLHFLKPIFRPITRGRTPTEMDEGFAAWSDDTSLDAPSNGRVRIIAELASGAELILVDTGDAALVWDSTELASVDNVHVAKAGMSVEFRDLYSHRGWEAVALPKSISPKSSSNNPNP